MTSHKGEPDQGWRPGVIVWEAGNHFYCRAGCSEPDLLTVDDHQQVV